MPSRRTPLVMAPPRHVYVRAQVRFEPRGAGRVFVRRVGGAASFVERLGEQLPLGDDELEAALDSAPPSLTLRPAHFVPDSCRLPSSGQSSSLAGW